MKPALHAVLVLTTVGLFLGIAAMPMGGTQAFFNDLEAARGFISANIPTAACAVFWANSTTAKDTFKITSSNNHFDACIHSNRDLVMNGGSNYYNKTLEYVAFYLTNNNGHTFVKGFKQVEAQPYPFPYDISRYEPGGCRAVQAAAKGQYFTGSGTYKIIQPGIKDGLYYVTGTIDADLRGYSGNITLVATQKIKLTTGVEGARPYTDALMAGAWGSGPNVITYGGNGGTLRGSLWAPNGHLSFSSNGMTFIGQAQANVISVSSSSTVFKASAPFEAKFC